MAQVRGSLVVNSGTDRITRTANLPSTTNFSMSVWVKFTSLTATWQYIVMLSDAEATNWLGAVINTNNRFEVQSSMAGISGDYSSISTDTWYYVSASNNGTNAVARIWSATGTLLFTSTANSASFTPTVMDFGNDDYTGGEQITGKLCYGRVWDAVLSQAELEDEMFSETPVRTANLNTAFNNADGTDESGNGRNWTLTNITTSSDFPDVFPSGFVPRTMLLGVG